MKSSGRQCNLPLPDFPKPGKSVGQVSVFDNRVCRRIGVLSVNGRSGRDREGAKDNGVFRRRNADVRGKAVETRKIESVLSILDKNGSTGLLGQGKRPNL